MQNKCIYKNKSKTNKPKKNNKKQTNNKSKTKQKTEEEQTEHTRISQLPHHGQSYTLQRKKAQNNSQKKRGKSGKAIRLLNVPSTCKHIIRLSLIHI